MGVRSASNSNNIREQIRTPYANILFYYDFWQKYLSVDTGEERESGSVVHAKKVYLPEANMAYVFDKYAHIVNGTIVTFTYLHASIHYVQIRYSMSIYIGFYLFIWEM